MYLVYLINMKILLCLKEKCYFIDEENGGFDGEDLRKVVIIGWIGV